MLSEENFVCFESVPMKKYYLVIQASEGTVGCKLFAE